MKKSEEQARNQSEQSKLHEKSKMTLNQEIQNYKEEAQKQRKIIYQLEKERDRYINEASDLTQKVILNLSYGKLNLSINTINHGSTWLTILIV